MVFSQCPDLVSNAAYYISNLYISEGLFQSHVVAPLMVLLLHSACCSMQRDVSC